MKKSLIFLILFALSSNASTDAQALVEEKCSSCHMINSSTKIKQDKISAPPMWGVMRKVKDAFSTDEEGIAFIIDYVKNPSEEKMLFPKATKEHFGLMPSLKNEMSNEELKAIANYLYKG
ncbi:MAG: cytochrome C [Arcobacter sp.]|nr:MAG: cytochrome C [Arcobacter sp.]